MVKDKKEQLDSKKGLELTLTMKYVNNVEKGINIKSSVTN